MNADLFPYELALRSPMATAHSIVAARTGALVRLVEEGRVGWGDLCPMPGWSADELSDLLDQLESGDDEWPPGAEARAAVAGARADLDAQHRGLSLAAHLTDAPLERVAVNATISAAEVSLALTTVNLALANGFTTFKLKVGHRPLDADIALVEGTRRAIGADGEIRLDANGGWSPAAAAEALDAFAAFDISFCEEPTAGIAPIAELAATSPVPLAVDESIRSLADLDQVLAASAIGHIVIKPQALGGPDRAMEAIRRAVAAGVTPIITSMIDSAVGVAHAVHVAAASGVTAAHGLATSAMLASDVATPLAVADGFITVPTSPGLGVAPNVV